ncbi:hypothetical protein L3X39_12285 [Sabulilitoribacter multivorans]|uniref:Threonine synthase n=1 Tax=Flaviramulus multivorans TaxID=1304750 RepID=A0ABS9ILC6_9FLAO|nr:DUF6503 family protein [Flaviramulus multivorans]MCF7561418.1 hypothetical protein [Flaviramulus multivorans]
MKIKLLILSLLLLIMSCKNKTENTTNYSEEKLDVTTSIYPENITKIFEAHGGLDTWNAMKSLEFTMTKPDGNEVTTTDLKNRNSLIMMPKHSIGFNGKDVWLQSKDTTAYKGNPRFYYNLMFYFYAMPFVLADDGIMYDEAEPLIFEGKSYPGIKISYESGVGESPEDEYILYYDSETNKMTWLGYTVTYFSKEKSKEFHFINYSNWHNVEGLLLPETLSWYNYENGLPTTKRNDLQFTDVKLSEEKPNQQMFEVPEGAELVE